MVPLLSHPSTPPPQCQMPPLPPHTGLQGTLGTLSCPSRSHTPPPLTILPSIQPNDGRVLGAYYVLQLRRTKPARNSGCGAGGERGTKGPEPSVKTFPQVKSRTPGRPTLSSSEDGGESWCEPEGSWAGQWPDAGQERRAFCAVWRSFDAAPVGTEIFQPGIRGAAGSAVAKPGTVGAPTQQKK